MKRIATIVVALALATFALESAAAQPAEQGTEDVVVMRKKPRLRLRIQPLYPNRHYHSIYPVPYPVEYPGPNAHRECNARYIQEFRPSGTVITPHVICRWVPGRYPGP